MKTAYNKQYDARYNVDTLEWLEKVCEDDHCPYCRKRPDKAPEPENEE